jgi:hypothetical protein
MAKVKKIVEADPEATDISNMTSEQKEKKLLRDLENARRKELQFEEFAQQQTKDLEDLAKQKDAVYFGRSLEDLPPDLKQKALEDIKSRGSTLAKDIYEDPFAMKAMELDKKNPDERLGKVDYISKKYPQPPSFAEELKQAGASGELLAKKFKEAGINIDEATREEALQEMERLREASRSAKRGSEWLERGMPMDTTPIIKDPEGARDVDIGKFREELARAKKFNGLKSSLSSGAKKLAQKLPAGLGVVTMGSALMEGEIPEAVLGAAEMGLGAAGKGISRYVPTLDLLRPTPIAPEEEEIEKIRFNTLNRLLKKKGLSSDI